MRRYPRTADDVDSDEEAEFRRLEYGSSPTPDDAAMSSTLATVVVPSRADASPALESVPKELSPATDGANEGMHCTKCTGERKRGPHTCSKKRNAPAVTQTDGARASRQRSSSTAPLLALDSAPARRKAGDRRFIRLCVCYSSRRRAVTGREGPTDRAPTYIRAMVVSAKTAHCRQ